MVKAKVKAKVMETGDVEGVNEFLEKGADMTQQKECVAYVCVCMYAIGMSKFKFRGSGQDSLVLGCWAGQVFGGSRMARTQGER